MGKRIQKNSWSLFIKPLNLIVNKLSNLELNRMIRLLSNEELSDAYYFDATGAKWIKVEVDKADRRPIELVRMKLPGVEDLAPPPPPSKPAAAPLAKITPVKKQVPATAQNLAAAKAQAHAKALRQKQQEILRPPIKAKPPAPKPAAPPPPPTDVIVQIQGKKLSFKVEKFQWPYIKTNPPIVSKVELECIVEVPGIGVFPAVLKHLAGAPKPNVCYIEIKVK